MKQQYFNPSDCQKIKCLDFRLNLKKIDDRKNTKLKIQNLLKQVIITSIKQIQAVRLATKCLVDVRVYLHISAKSSTLAG
ncbi:hypothetical protein GS19_06265 [Acinetobacter idrijaensis]|jgi:hypothetical protein|uniref:hypothetical protein n=1 Tax=Acinetobacter lwoffii TaxID=28090 RepID=UPI000362DB7F|nr:hypothetical protein GS19_06265 [Acinetobacter idrijaensis]QZD34652.1 hypothetical protein ABEKA_2710 [Acinetobacter lwoffii]GEA64584.1 hypothetical protein AL1T_18620 [Acinetobacter lwoffii]